MQRLSVGYRYTYHNAPHESQVRKVGLRDTLRGLFAADPGAHTRVPARSGISMDEWLSYFSFNGSSYPFGLTSWTPEGEESIGHNWGSYVDGAVKANGVVFAAMLIRQQVFSEARLVWRRFNNGRPGATFGTADLALFERPWPAGSSTELLARMMQDVDVAGNAFVARRGDRLRRMRPDWVTIAYASPERVAGDAGTDLDLDVIGYNYYPGGLTAGNEPVRLTVSDVAHWAPIPDPARDTIGMSWLTPIIREIQADKAATVHRKKFFENAATPNLMVKLDISDPVKFKEWVDLFNKDHQGSDNAYKTLFLGAGADPTVIGANFQQMDFKNTVGVGETRIAMASGVPATILGTTEGLQGSTLNAGNYNSARRRFADGTMSNLWRSACQSLETIVPPPPGAELWYYADDIPFLQEDKADRADIQMKQAGAIGQLVRDGFTPDSAVAAVNSDDMALLVHTGLFSVQLQPAGELSANVPDEQVGP